MSSEISREEHLAWCKKRAIEFAEGGDHSQAMASFSSDINKHEGTRHLRQLVKDLWWPMQMGGMFRTNEELIKHIEGYQ